MIGIFESMELFISLKSSVFFSLHFFNSLPFLSGCALERTQCTTPYLSSCMTNLVRSNNPFGQKKRCQSSVSIHRLEKCSERYELESRSVTFSRGSLLFARRTTRARGWMAPLASSSSRDPSVILHRPLGLHTRALTARGEVCRCLTKVEFDNDVPLVNLQ